MFLAWIMLGLSSWQFKNPEFLQILYIGWGRVLLYGNLIFVRIVSVYAR